jgi:rhamnulokinase
VTAFAAVDLGASGGRVMRGRITGDQVTVEPVHRFPNKAVEVDGHLRWNFTGLYREVQTGLALIPDAESIGIDTWGVDYGLLDAAGELIAEPVSYRDQRTSEVIADVHKAVAPEDLYAITGTQFLPLNTIYQLAAERRGPSWERVAHVVLLPDLLAYWLTGALRSELTNASTTGLLDAHAQTWSNPLLNALEIAPELLPSIEHPGTVRGVSTAGTTVTTVGSHDTASAVAAVPTTTNRFAYVSSGTWSLVGVEIEAPILTDMAREANFTNEIGVDGRTRFLRNVGGLWVLQECMREWGRNDFTELLGAAACLPTNGPTVDINDATFVAPGPMEARVAAAAGRASLTPPETVRCIVDSLSFAYARAVEDATALTHSPIDVIHIIGGGSQNELLCQLTADAAGVPVVAGPVEATALGNVIVQARAHGALPESLEAVRAGVATSTSLRRYEPS